MDNNVKRKPTKQQLLENKIRKIYKKILREDDRKWKIGGEYRTMQDKFKSMKMDDIVPIINNNTGWDYNEITELVKLLLIDANFHDEASKVYEFMMNLE